jgi:hypothetical protein
MLRAKDDTFRKMYSAAKGYYCGGLAAPNPFSGSSSLLKVPEQ